MDKLWVKWLTVLLIMYTFIAGMVRPLNSGIMDINPGRSSTGTMVTMAVSTYNTHFKQGDHLAWLRLDSLHAIKAYEIEVMAANEIKVTFDIPLFLPVKDKVVSTSLILANTKDGAFSRPGAMMLTQDSVNTVEGGVAWTVHQISELPAGESIGFPYRSILEETIRNIYYHVPFWMAMMVIFTIALFYAVRFLVTKKYEDNLKVYALNRVGFFYGMMGLITGAIWAKYTWGQYWSGDIKQNMTAIALLIYAAYFVLWKSFKDDTVQARVTSTYTIFAYVAMIPLLYVIPRMYDSLHPGNGGNPALGGEDLDATMRMVFYPGVIGFTLLGLWLGHIYYRIQRIDYNMKQ